MSLDLHLNNLNYMKMKAIFRSIVGMTLISGLFMIFGALIQFFAPQLGPLMSIVKGFVFITLLMGVIIISRSSIELFHRTSLNE